jgi:hypothetical protein
MEATGERLHSPSVPPAKVSPLLQSERSRQPSALDGFHSPPAPVSGEQRVPRFFECAQQPAAGCRGDAASGEMPPHLSERYLVALSWTARARTTRGSYAPSSGARSIGKTPSEEDRPRRSRRDRVGLPSLSCELCISTASSTPSTP